MTITSQANHTAGNRDTGSSGRSGRSGSGSAPIGLVICSA